MSLLRILYWRVRSQVPRPEQSAVSTCFGTVVAKPRRRTRSPSAATRKAKQSARSTSRAAPGRATSGASRPPTTRLHLQSASRATSRRPQARGRRATGRRLRPAASLPKAAAAAPSGPACATAPRAASWRTATRMRRDATRRCGGPGARERGDAARASLLELGRTETRKGLRDWRDERWRPGRRRRGAPRRQGRHRRPDGRRAFADGDLMHARASFAGALRDAESAPVVLGAAAAELGLGKIDRCLRLCLQVLRRADAARWRPSALVVRGAATLLSDEGSQAVEILREAPTRSGRRRAEGDAARGVARRKRRKEARPLAEAVVRRRRGRSIGCSRTIWQVPGPLGRLPALVAAGRASPLYARCRAERGTCRLRTGDADAALKDRAAALYVVDDLVDGIYAERMRCALSVATQKRASTSRTSSTKAGAGGRPSEARLRAGRLSTCYVTKRPDLRVAELSPSVLGAGDQGRLPRSVVTTSSGPPRTASPEVQAKPEVYVPKRLRGLHSDIWADSQKRATSTMRPLAMRHPASWRRPNARSTQSTLPRRTAASPGIPWASTCSCPGEAAGAKASCTLIYGAGH